MNKQSIKIENQNPTEKLFLENEIKTNELGVKCILFLIMVVELVGILSATGIFGLVYTWAGWLLIISGLFVLVLYFVMKYIGYDDPRTKLLVLLGIILLSMTTYFIFPLTTVIIVFGPIMVSMKYYDPKLTVKVTIVTWAAFMIAVAANIILEYASPAVSELHVVEGMLLWSELDYVLPFYIPPRTMVYAMEAVIGYRIANAGRKLVIEQAKISTEAALMSTELSTASAIQKAALASPDFTTPDGRIILSAGVRPAREVGGDFYDHFMINEHLLAVVVADVSDKGLPAAMYAVEAQSCVRFALTESLLRGLESSVEFINLEKAMNAVNRQLSIKNMDGMFVTMWIGCFDTRSGVGKFINAGHTRPYIKHADGTITQVTNDPQVFLGTFVNEELKAKPIKLWQGDTLLIYTDGVTDARNTDGETFGTERLEAVIADTAVSKNQVPASAIMDSVNGALREYIGNDAPYDDITLMTLSYMSESHSSKYTLSMQTSDECASGVIDFVNEKLSTCSCPDEFRRNQDVIIDEICTNISTYAYDGKTGPMEFSLHVGINYISMRFIDSGIKFDPLKAQTPDLAGEPQIGGLGIHLVRSLADLVEYRYEDGRNILTIYSIWNM